MKHTPPGLLNGRRYAGQCIGLLGGSFNPAHAGHRAVALAALQKISGLDRIWWLVSPQNPLKSSAETAAHSVRMNSVAQQIAGHPRMQAVDIESRLSTNRTADLVKALSKRFPKTRFIWLIGADNLAQLPRWYRWLWLFHNIHLAIVPRSPYSLVSLRGKAAIRFKRYRCHPRVLCHSPLPAWSLVPMRLNPLSSTALRRKTLGV